MKIKVCGMREAANMQAVDAFGIDYMGFIFYEKSPRNCTETIQTPINAARVGVFVNSSMQQVEDTVAAQQLKLVQLHGNESADYCKVLKDKGIGVIKAFRVDQYFDFQLLQVYEGSCDYFLFDAKGAQYGGNGIQFDWNILQRYSLKLPFFLSGGIDLQSLAAIKNLQIPQLYAIDVNSKFEIKPGLKNIEMIEQLTQQMSFQN